MHIWPAMHFLDYLTRLRFYEVLPDPLRVCHTRVGSRVLGNLGSPGGALGGPWGGPGGEAWEDAFEALALPSAHYEGGACRPGGPFAFIGLSYEGAHRLEAAAGNRIFRPLGCRARALTSWSGLGGFRPNPQNHGAPGETRTPNLLVRSQTLYPIELRARERSASRIKVGCRPPDAKAARTLPRRRGAPQGLPRDFRKARQGLGVAWSPPISARGILACPARIHPLLSAPTGGGSRTINAFVNESGAHAELIGGLFDE